MYKILIVEYGSSPPWLSCHEASYIQNFGPVTGSSRTWCDWGISAFPFSVDTTGARNPEKISPVPIIFLSSAADELNQVTALSMGGDDFISKACMFFAPCSAVPAACWMCVDGVGAEFPIPSC